MSSTSKTAFLISLDPMTGIAVQQKDLDISTDRIAEEKRTGNLSDFKFSPIDYKRYPISHIDDQFYKEGGYKTLSMLRIRRMITRQSSK